MRQRQFGAQVGIGLDQGHGKHFAEHFLKGLAINPESLVVVALSQGESHQAHPPAPCQGGVRGGVIKGRLQMAVVVLGAALEERFAQARPGLSPAIRRAIAKRPRTGHTRTTGCRR